MLEIGKTLREAREARNLTLAEVEEATKIRKYYLSALEDEDFQALPGQVYAIGFIKNYARFLGLDANTLADAFKSREDAPPLPLQTTPKARRRPRPAQAEGASWLKKHGWKTALLLLAAVLAVFWLVESGYLNYSQPAPANPVQNETTDDPINNPINGITLTPVNSEVKIELAASGECWVLAIADNQEIFRGIINRGDHKLFTAKNKLSLTLGNAGVVEVFQDDKPLGYLGRVGQVVRKEFTLSSE